MKHSRLIYFPSGFHSSLDALRIGYFLRIYKRQMPPEIPWEMTVAKAGPSTPICRTKMDTKSRTIFRADETARNTTGVLLSPSDRITAASILYKNVHGMPQKMIKIYTYAYSKISSGVFIILRTGPQTAATRIVRNTENPMQSHAPLVTNRRSLLSSLAPNIWATGIAKPLHTPMQNPMTIKFKEVVEPTPARGLTPRYCPTMTVSTIL